MKKTRKKRVLSGGIFVLSLMAIFCSIQMLSFPENKARAANGLIRTTVRAYGPPEKPVVTAATGCTIQRTPSVRIEWPTDENATGFDVYRDNIEIMTGLTDNFYTDISIAKDGSYFYYVVAKGPEGVEISDSVAVIASPCPAIANPIVQVTAIEGSNTEDIGGMPQITEKNPIFSGTTNIPYAIVKLEIHSEQVIYAETTANEVGFWQWSSPVDLTEEIHTLYVTAIDPEYPTNITTTSFVFEIVNKSEGAGEKKDGDDSSDDSDKKKTEEKKQASFAQGTIVSTSPENGSDKDVKEEDQADKQKEINFHISLVDEDYIEGISVNNIAYRGENMEVQVTFTDKVRENEKVLLSYLLISPDRETVEEYSDTVFPAKKATIIKSIPLWHKLNLGKYKFQVIASQNGIIVSRENYFILRDRPDSKEKLGRLSKFVQYFMGIIVVVFWPFNQFVRGALARRPAILMVSWLSKKIAKKK
ncbi:MAG TPA: hypothetical protein VK254_00915 [Candidatus Bathyarchaeia archaeon]|nr:hypothetical protein [Candidatus Bathyarchaeia archaeon]